MPGKVVSPAEWLTARKALLVQEKAALRADDKLNAQLRDFPMVKLDKNYTFSGPNGSVTLADLFEGRKQLIVYHFMLDPKDEVGCHGCSFLADNLPTHAGHLNSRNTTLVLVSRAPYEKIAKFKERMGWPFPWFSSYGTDFNYDFHVTQDEDVAPVLYNYKTEEEMANDKHKMTKGEGPGMSVFFNEGDEIFHTYSTYARGLDTLLVTHRLLDITPLGRQESMEDWKFHDEYAGKESKACAHCAK